MKILIVCNDLQVLCLHRGALVAAIVERGYDLAIMSDKDHDPAFDHLPGVKLIKSAFSHHRLDLLNDLKLAYRIGAWIVRERPEIVHTFTIKPNLFSTLAFGFIQMWKGPLPRLINTFPGLGKLYEPSHSRLATLRRKLVSAVFRQCSRRLDHVATFENPRDKDYMVGQGTFRYANTVSIMGAGIDVARFYPPPFADRKGPVRFLLASRLIKAKGIPNYVSAAQRMEKAGIKAEFLIAGSVDLENPDAFDAENLARSNALRPVQYLGPVRAEAMPDLLRSVDVVCLPTLLSEGFPRVLIEAAACGCALIASDQPSIRQVVIPHKTGWLINPADPDSLYETMKQAVATVGATRKLGEAAARFVRALPVSDADVVSSFLRLYDLREPETRKN